MPSRAKLMPSAGSGSSGGTSSAGRSTTHDESGWPYRHRFSFSGSHFLKNSSTSVRMGGRARVGADERGGIGEEEKRGPEASWKKAMGV